MTIYNIETEKALLCSILVEPKVIDDVIEYVDEPECFYDSLHQKVFKAILSLYEKSEAIDLVTVVNEVGERYAVVIAELMDTVATSVNAVSYAKQVKEQYVLRKLREACSSGLEMIKKQESPVDDIASAIDTNIMMAVKGLTSYDALPISELVYQRFCKYHEDVGNGYKYEGIPTGFIDLDRLIDGFGLSENIIIAARPSMGKTALALNIARNVAEREVPVMFFSLEMKKERLVDRLLCAEAGVSPKAYRYRLLRDSDTHRLSGAMESLAKLPIEIMDGSMNTSHIRAAISRAIKKNRKMLVFIDFLTLLTDYPNLKAHERYGSIAKKVQRMAIEFNIPIVMLAQLNRKVEERSDKRPILSDLRESGNLEEAADKVIFIYRDEYYTGENKGIAEIITAKNRDGETGTVELSWTPQLMQFRNMARKEYLA